MPRTAFFAFPNAPQLISDAATDAAKHLNATELTLIPWPKLNIIGLKLDDLIRNKIEAADFLAADITYPNFNVYYEIGYAVGRGKPFVPTLDFAVDKANEHFHLTGLLDTTGAARYQNGSELADALRAAKPEPFANNFIRSKDHTQPLFVLDPLRKTEFRNYIFQTVANNHLKYRTFDPLESTRLSIDSAVTDISASSGVIIPLISTDITDWERHNLRAAFLAGLCHGFEIEPLVIQYEDAPAPLDFRDLLETTRTKLEVEQAVTEYCQETLIRNQQRETISRRGRKGLLDRIDIGQSAAENEIGQLGRYFVRTAQYARAVRAEAGVVVGRKGSGKSAIFFQLLEDAERTRSNVILDLRPASHNLSWLREQLLSVVNVGVFEHTIAAFWQYILYAEILLKFREEILPKAKYSMAILERTRDLEKQFHLTDEMVSGDFTSRLELAIKAVTTGLRKVPPGKDIREHLTNILFEGDIPNLRDAVVSLGAKNTIVLLLDDLDKGWPARQIEQHDIKTIQHLIAVLNRIQRDLSRRGIEFKHLLFLRSDVYETLIDQTADRGKYNTISVDWSDADQLAYMLQQRVISNFESDHDAAQAWAAVNPELEGGTSAIELMTQNSLMRPRFLIDLCEKALSFAINRGHGAVQDRDLQDALKQHSLLLVRDFGYEIRDVSGLSERIFYAFVGKGETLTPDEVKEIVVTLGGSLPPEQIIELFIWYGFLGIPDTRGKPVYIYEREYDMRRMQGERDRQGTDLLYVVNPAFMRGLAN